MAGNTLDTVRTGALNVELGLTSDSDDRFGTTAQRNYALTEAYRRLWPRMAQLDTAAVTIVTDQTAYTLSALQEVLYLELRDADGIFITRLNNFRVRIEDDTTYTLLIPEPMSTTLLLTAVGYAPYTIPASGSGTSTLPADKEWIVVQGARALLYRRQLNQFAVFERHANENRRTTMQASEMMSMAREAEAMFRDGIRENGRRMAVGRRATTVR